MRIRPDVTVRVEEIMQEQMRLVAQALAGLALMGGDLPDVSPTGELAALTKLLANWRSVVEDATLSALEKEERRTGQRRISQADVRRATRALPSERASR